MLEIYMPLTRGGVLVMVHSATQKDPFRLVDVIAEQCVSVVQATPTTYEMMLATGWRGDAKIDFLVWPPHSLSLQLQYVIISMLH
jgi:acyl-coenzyme A synthetase/AMP-(fatty) acid ligase